MFIRKEFSFANRSYGETLPAIVDAVIQGQNTIAICVDQDRGETVGPIVEDVSTDIVARFSSSVYDSNVDVAIELACSITLSSTWVV
jgi:hypothetical protein